MSGALVGAGWSLVFLGILALYVTAAALLAVAADEHRGGVPSGLDRDPRPYWHPAAVLVLAVVCTGALVGSLM